MARKHDAIIKQLSLEEKAAFMSGKTFWETLNIDHAGIPSIFLSDGPHGLRKQAAASDHLGLNASIPATCFPTAATMANSWNPELGEKLGELLGEEAISMDVNVVLGPGCNTKRSPLCGRNFEYFSEDPYLAGKLAAAYIRGIQSTGVSACVKHFACNNQEMNRMTLDSIVDERALRELYLTQFEIAVAEGKTKSIMSSYNLINGQYANENQHTLVDILRKEWGYKGTVISDWGGDNDRIDALKAYNELEMPTSCGATAREIVEAVKNGTLDEAILDDNVDSMIDFVLDVAKATKGEKKPFDVEQHHKFAKEFADESIVLLKNENVLPLKPKTKVAFIGDFLYNFRYQGAGSSIVNPTKIDNPIDVLGEYDLEVVATCKGFDRFGKKKNNLTVEALQAANKSDVVVCYLGLDEVTEAEGLDRKNMNLPANQIELINALKSLEKPIVVVLCCGSAVELPFYDDIKGLVYACLSGQAGCRATLDILTGKVNPSGKLAETFAIHLNDVASMDNFPSHKRTIEYRESLAVGYRYFDKAEVPVRFPFGYGLSYTTFEYKNLEVTEKGVNFEITNTGKIAGKEIAQLYIGKKETQILRPLKELKGFVKVALKPGETKKVTINFDDKSFRYFNVKTNKWEVEDGEYEIYIGASTADIRLNGKISQKGTTKELPNKLSDVPTYASGKVRNIPDEEFKIILGRDIPNGEIPFVKKNRIIVDYNTTVLELRYAKGWTGRFFSWVIGVAVKLLWNFGNKSLSNTLVMGVVHQPMRGLSRLSGGAIKWSQLNGLMTMFNGHFFKGLGMYLKGDKIYEEKK